MSDAETEARARVGRLLAAYRKRAGLTQESLARIVFTSRSNLAGIETGRQGSPRDLWQRVDDTTQAHGALLSAYDVMCATLVPPVGDGDADGMTKLMPGARPEGGEPVDRRRFVASVGTVAGASMLAASAVDPDAVGPGVDDPAVWLAWEMWHQRVPVLDTSLVPPRLRPALGSDPRVIADAQGYWLRNPAIVDVLVAQRILDDVRSGSPRLLATAQTSHATDTRLGALIRDDGCAHRSLTAWMRTGATPVLRVNAAGILAKIGESSTGDTVITTLGHDHDSRHLYLTAVASRVLDTGWDEASSLAALTCAPGATVHLTGPTQWAAHRLVTEIVGSRDAAARWCATVLLSGLSPRDRDAARDAVACAARSEPCRENLRAFAAFLGGATPIA
jgi:DNA-binding XRE family transcriptional regulator